MCKNIAQESDSHALSLNVDGAAVAPNKLKGVYSRTLMYEGNAMLERDGWYSCFAGLEAPFEYMVITAVDS
jgi:hypothetical protein